MKGLSIAEIIISLCTCCDRFCPETNLSILILHHNCFSLNHQMVAGDCVSGGDRGDYPLVLLPAATSLPGSTWTPQQAACARGNHTTSSTSRPDIMVDKFSDGSNCQYIASGCNCISPLLLLDCSQLYRCLLREILQILLFPIPQ